MQNMSEGLLKSWAKMFCIDGFLYKANSVCFSHYFIVHATVEAPKLYRNLIDILFINIWLCYMSNKLHQKKRSFHKFGYKKFHFVPFKTIIQKTIYPLYTPRALCGTTIG